MISWITWPVEWLIHLLTRDRTNRIEQEITEHLNDPRYLTVKEWANLHGISEDKAEHQLEAAVKAGALEKMYLYRGPVDFVVPKNRLDTKVSPSELGLIGEDDEPILISKFQTTPVYVAPNDVEQNVPSRHVA